jgi:hypothetical protein
VCVSQHLLCAALKAPSGSTYLLLCLFIVLLLPVLLLLLFSFFLFTPVPSQRINFHDRSCQPWRGSAAAAICVADGASRKQRS